MSDSKHVTYEDAGVDTAEGGRAVDAIKQMVKDTNRPGSSAASAALVACSRLPRLRIWKTRF